MCRDCVALQDPHCAWDVRQNKCIEVNSATSRYSLIQDILNGDSKKCRSPQQVLDNRVPLTKSDEITQKTVIGTNVEDNDITNPSIQIDSENNDCENDINSNEVGGCAVHQKLVIYTAETLRLVVFGACVVGLLLGFLAGYLVSRKLNSSSQYPGAPFIEQHNHLDR